MNDEEKLPEVSLEDIERVASEMDPAQPPAQITLAHLIQEWLEDKDSPITDAFTVDKRETDGKQTTVLGGLEWELVIAEDIVFKQGINKETFSAADPTVFDKLKAKITDIEHRTWTKLDGLFPEL